MFVDTATITVKAGDGGNGAVSFRHEKFVDKGGPDGGDGGKGADVIFVASYRQNTLANFRFQKQLHAEAGTPGSKRKKHGKNGQNLIVPVPVGTAIIGGEGEVLADLTFDGQAAIVARGGLGGFGNAHFVSSTRQAPRMAEKGEPGEELTATLELKMIADVGLVGLPNAGKSTLLSVISNAHPEIANYPFTTLVPNLGMVKVDDENTLLFADIPGLIEGASAGKGLGDDFLRHVERTLVLIHLIDCYESDVAQAYKTIQTELKAYKIDLSKKPQLVVLTKIDGLDDDIVKSQQEELKKVVPKSTKVYAISSPSKVGIQELLYGVNTIVIKERAKQLAKAKPEDTLPVIEISKEQAWKVKKTDQGFVVTGRKIERFAMRTDFENNQGVQRLRDIMKKMGIMHELVRQGIEPGQKIKISTVGSVEY